MPGDPLTYREAYARLSRIAAELDTGEADLDRVLPLLEEARAAYAACRERIAAVQSALSGDWGEEEDGPDDENAVPAPDPDDDPF
ncbi:exodeoxyribonuclease VII small subunit [Deinococcus sp. MIMF12]|uniref:Exodeoxyribonuclease VII small subunit n=1 Tax=Deinococcus rhizophilus TaxID=3049544 RepID=A0ABT7JJW9_9DEIO|nr:exodeoxyribonuclease VII small subunit [Deinococcus rhizophilus]MDL2345251.1 exodeoxyribonuclease VII small subunit [Deinococcus rhizophilus]